MCWTNGDHKTILLIREMILREDNATKKSDYSAHHNRLIIWDSHLIRINVNFFWEKCIMKRHASVKTVLSMLLVLTAFTAVSSAEEVAQPQRRTRGGLYGDWNVKSDFNGRSMESILAFTRDKDGKQIGQWISFWGISELKELKFEDGKLSFERENRGRDGQTSTSKFTGTIKDGKLSGTFTSSRGDYELEGTRSPRTSRAVGQWAMTMTIEEKEHKSTLTIKADKEGVLSANWSGERGEHEMRDVKYERGKLTFKNTPSNEEHSFDMTFEGTIRGDALSGTLKSERGELTTEGKRIGAEVIGTWNLDVASEQQNRKQRLKVNPDMSGLYGSTPVKKVVVDGDKVSFKIVLKFGDREFEMSFAGKLEETKLIGELTTSRGTQKITGTKVIRSFGRRTSGQRPTGARTGRTGTNAG